MVRLGISSNKPTHSWLLISEIEIIDDLDLMFLGPNFGS